MQPMDRVKRIKDRYRELILARPNVVGVGAGYKSVSGQVTDRLSVVTLVKQKLPRLDLPPEALVPFELEGILTDVVEVGELRALNQRAERIRPVPGGVSVGHFRVSAGTFGGVVRDRRYGTRLILSNNHVLANSNDAIPGDEILQPAVLDGGTVNTDAVAYLARFAPIRFLSDMLPQPPPPLWTHIRMSLARLLKRRDWLAALTPKPVTPANRVDAAVARPREDSDVLDEIVEIGVIKGIAEAELGMAVRKSGRTSGLTTGTVCVLDATVTVSYNDGRGARFDHQILTTPMSKTGDSGSLLVEADSPTAVGLVFAGSSRVTIHNPIRWVLDELEVRL